MPEVHSPIVRRHELGALLRALRTDKGFTVDQVAERLLCSPSKVSRMETGQRGVTARDIRDLCDIYEITDKTEREHLAQLAREGKQTGWWQPYDLDDFATYVGLEAEAVGIRYYQSTVMPGLLQTPEYTRAIHLAAIPEIPTSRIEELIEVKLIRQRVLRREPSVQLEVVFDEATLHRVVGSPAVMSAQLERLVEVSALSNVTVQVIPFRVGAHPAMNSTFNLLHFSNLPHAMVYVEDLLGKHYLQSPHDTARYQQVFERLRTVALSPRDSIDLIAEIGIGYRSATLSLAVPGGTEA